MTSFLHITGLTGRLSKTYNLGVGFNPKESVTVLIVLAKSLGQILVNQGSILVKN
jgi:hypothetical protein